MGRPHPVRAGGADRGHRERLRDPPGSGVSGRCQRDVPHVRGAFIPHSAEHEASRQGEGGPQGAPGDRHIAEDARRILQEQHRQFGEEDQGGIRQETREASARKKAQETGQEEGLILFLHQFESKMM